MGDIESLALSWKRSANSGTNWSRGQTLSVHVTLVPYIKAAGELKTKPTQHSVRELAKPPGSSLICCFAAPNMADTRQRTPQDRAVLATCVPKR